MSSVGTGRGSPINCGLQYSLVKHSSIKKIHGNGIKDFLPFTGQDLMLLEMCQENQEIRRHADLSCPVLDLFEKEVWRD